MPIAHTLDDVRANNTPGGDGVVDVKSSGGELPVNTDNMTYEFYEQLIKSALSYLKQPEEEGKHSNEYRDKEQRDDILRNGFSSSGTVHVQIPKS